MNKLDKAKEIITKYFSSADCGLFNTHGIDPETGVVYDEDGLTINVNFYWCYAEVFGLSDEEFAELEKWYDQMRRNYYGR